MVAGRDDVAGQLSTVPTEELGRRIGSIGSSHDQEMESRQVGYCLLANALAGSSLQRQHSSRSSCRSLGSVDRVRRSIHDNGSHTTADMNGEWCSTSLQIKRSNKSKVALGPVSSWRQRRSRIELVAHRDHAQPRDVSAGDAQGYGAHESLPGLIVAMRAAGTASSPLSGSTRSSCGFMPRGS